MTDRQKLEIRASEIRSRLNEIIGIEGNLPAEIRTESDTLRTELTDVETRYRAALAAETEETRETVVTEGREECERESLRRRASLGRYLAAAVEQRGVDGVEAEYAAACACAGKVPLGLFDPDVPAAAEARAVTPGVDAVAVTQPTVPYVFQQSASAALGLAFPSVATGVQHIPVIATAPPASTVAKGAAAPATAASVRLDTRSPKRISGQFEIRAEDVAVFPTMEADLRMALSESLSNTLDDQVIAGDGNAPNLSGLLAQATDVTAHTAVENFATGIKRFADLIDGRYAYGFADIRAAIGSETFSLYASVFRSAGGDVSLFDYLSSRLGSLRVSDRLPDAASDAQKGIVTLTASRQLMTVPTWDSLDIIVDPYSQAGKGIRVVTATALVGDPHIPHLGALAMIHPKVSA